MKAHLMFKDEDLDLEVVVTRGRMSVAGSELPPNADELIQDLELTTLFQAMALGDPFLYELAKHGVLSSLEDPEGIVYRQNILNDCIAHPEVAREMYAIAIAAIAGERQIYRSIRANPSGTLGRAIAVLETFVVLLLRLRRIADDHAEEFHSEGLATFFSMLKENLDDAYFATIDDHLRRLKFTGGTLISAELGEGNTGVRYVLHAPTNRKPRWTERIGLAPRDPFTFEISPRDEAGTRALRELIDRGINDVANALAQSTDHILGFFSVLAVELGFYVGCLNLRGRLAEIEQPMCMPDPVHWTPPVFSCRGVYDVCLAVQSETWVVGNDADADGKSLVMITGANSGGKSTFLRSIGVAQLMMQCGMFVGATSFRANVCEGLFTHFTREEDASMTSGKLDEELARMSAIADRLRPRSIVLFNESFAATNEREGSEIARQIVSALLDAGLKVLFVTHQFTLADGFNRERSDTTLFLRAERQVDGQRNFKLVEGGPLPTSFGEDLYERIGGLTASNAPRRLGAIGDTDHRETSDDAGDGP
jgi:hypothetical protein